MQVVQTHVKRSCRDNESQDIFVNWNHHTTYNCIQTDVLETFVIYFFLGIMKLLSFFHDYTHKKQYTISFRLPWKSQMKWLWFLSLHFVLSRQTSVSRQNSISLWDWVLLQPKGPKKFLSQSMDWGIFLREILFLSLLCHCHTWG